MAEAFLTWTVQTGNMTTSAPHIERANPRTAPETALRAVAEHREAMRAERMPQDPPLVLDKLVAAMRQVPTDEDVLYLDVWEGERVVGHAAVYLPLLDNTHLAGVDLSVLAGWRRQGLGTLLLREALSVAESRGRSKLMGDTYDRIPAGEAFLRTLGAQAALSNHENQLDLSELPPGLLDEWTREGASGYRVWTHAGPYPEERLEAVADLLNVMNTAPRGDLDIQDSQFTPQRVREWEAQNAAAGVQVVNTFAIHVESGALAGMTELGWQAGRDTLLIQYATAVRPEHRRRGLGKWIKAANLRAALELNPEARFVRTGNADSNAGMLSINRALGFKPLMARTEWQIGAGELGQALEGKGPHLS